MSGMEHYDEELLALDKRIKRLAISCGIDLDKKGIIVSLIKGDYSMCSSGANPKRKELRGLLMLKYDIQEHCIESLGTDECFKIVEGVDDKLKKAGFN